MIYIQRTPPSTGNSGGALVDTEGRLVGISTLIYSQSGGNEGIGFAAPSNIVRNVFEQIRKTGRVRRGEIGIATQTVTATLAEALKLGGDAGVIVADVDEGSPAAKAGMQPGDVIHALDGKRMENGRQFRIKHLHADHRPGGHARRAARRAPARGAGPVFERENTTTRLSDLLTPQNSIRALAWWRSTSPRKSNRCCRASPQPRGRRRHRVGGSPLLATGTVAGWGCDLQLNGQPIESVAALRAAVDRLKPLDAAVLQIEREGGLMFIAFRAEAR